MVTALLGAIGPGTLEPVGGGLWLPEHHSPGVWDTPAVDAILEAAARIAAEPDPCLPYSAYLRFFQDGNRQEYEDWYFARRRRLGVLALAVLSGRGKEYLPPLQNLLWAICEESTWALPAHLPHPGAFVTVDLFAAETASALAEIRGVADEHLEAGLKARIEAEIENRVFAPFLAPRAPWDWESAAHNWSAVCGGGVGIAALWLLDNDRLTGLLRRLGPCFDAYLSGFSDGVCLEGMGYWTYGFGYFVAFAEMLRERSREKIDLLSHPPLVPRLASIAAFPGVGRLGNRHFVRFADSPDEYRFPLGLATRLARRLGTPQGLDPSRAEDFDSDRCCRWVRQLREVLWIEATQPVSLPPTGAVWYPNAQWLVARGQQEGAAIGWAAKGGHNGEPHNHNDLGSFQLVVGDEVFIDDFGAGRYERDYFREGRYSSFVTSSRSHSVPLIDGQEQAPGADHRARDVEFTPPTTLTMALEGAYEVPGLGGFRRRFVWTPETVLPLTVTDAFQFSEPGHEPYHQVIERFVTGLPATVDGSAALIVGRNHRLRITSEPPAEVRVTPVVYPPHEGPDRTALCIDFCYPIAAAEVRLTFELLL